MFVLVDYTVCCAQDIVPEWDQNGEPNKSSWHGSELQTFWRLVEATYVHSKSRRKCSGVLLRDWLVLFVLLSYYVPVAVMHLPVSYHSTSSIGQSGESIGNFMFAELLSICRCFRMDVQDQLVKATYQDLDLAPRPAAGKLEPDEFDVDAFNVGACISIPCSRFVSQWHQ